MSKNIAEAAEALVAPEAESLGLVLWDVELTREDGALTLLVTVDREGGVSLDDCAALTNRINPLLDEADLISSSYCLEVSSVGTTRVLRRREHYDYAIRTGLPCTVRLFSPLDGKREFRGRLVAFDGEAFTFAAEGGTVVLPKKAAAKLCIEHEM